MPKGLPKVHAPWRPGPELQSVLHRLGLGDESLHAIRLHSEIGDIGMRALSAILHGSSPNLSEVYLSGNNIGDEGAIVLTKALATGSAGQVLARLDLRANMLGSTGIEAFAGLIMMPLQADWCVRAACRAAPSGGFDGAVRSHRCWCSCCDT